MRRTTWILAGLVCAGLLLTGLFSWWKRSVQLPFDGNEGVQRNAWRDYGGLWSLQSGTIFNRSDELGSKLVAGSSKWTNYKLSADMRTLGHRGEVGVVVRVADAGDGINAYRGYYAGFRSMDHSLILGFSDHDWVETRPVPLSTHLQFDDWLHISVVAVGCEIGAELTVIRTGETARSLLRQDDCAVQGKVALRSLSTGAAWKNILVVPATVTEITDFERYVPVPGKAIYPTREDDLVKMLMAEPTTPDRFLFDFMQKSDNGPRAQPPLPVQSIASLSASLKGPLTATIQGAVTHVDPLYIQDSSGGTAVRSNLAAALNLGDEVELVGQAVHTSDGAYFDAKSTRLLWDDVPTRPVAITSEQAASGMFDGSLVELSGKLLARSVSADGQILLRMTSGTEEFSVVVQQSLSRRSVRAWEIGSTLRVRGVCSLKDRGLPSSDLFQILPRSVADVQLVSGPPWNSGLRLVLLIALGVILLGAVVFAYIRAERWKLRTIYEERERLAADMHDTLAQGFAGVSYQLQSLRRGLRETVEVPKNLMQRLDTACELATDTHREASTRITALHFAAEEDYDVLDVLKRAITLMIGSESPLEVVTERRGTPHSLSLAIRDALFRIGHEAIANVLRHSRATRLLLRLELEEDAVLLEMADNGIGFAHPGESGFGIASMRGRVEECKGELQIVTAANEGTVVSVRLPYQRRGRLWHNVRAGVNRAFHRRVA